MTEKVELFWGISHFDSRYSSFWNTTNPGKPVLDVQFDYGDDLESAIMLFCEDLERLDFVIDINCWVRDLLYF